MAKKKDVDLEQAIGEEQTVGEEISKDVEAMAKVEETVETDPFKIYEAKLRKEISDEKKRLEDKEAGIADKLKFMKKMNEIDGKIEKLQKERAEIASQIGLVPEAKRAGTKSAGTSRVRQQSITGEHDSIKAVVYELLAADPKTTSEVIVAAVKKEFPGSAFSPTHVSYYKSKIKSEGM